MQIKRSEKPRKTKATFVGLNKGKSKNIIEMKHFAKFLLMHPELRFWQALQHWSFEYNKRYHPERPEVRVILAGFDEDACEDTFYWES